MFDLSNQYFMTGLSKYKFLIKGDSDVNSPTLAKNHFYGVLIEKGKYQLWVIALTMIPSQESNLNKFLTTVNHWFLFLLPFSSMIFCKEI